MTFWWISSKRLSTPPTDTAENESNHIWYLNSPYRQDVAQIRALRECIRGVSPDCVLGFAGWAHFLYYVVDYDGLRNVVS